MDYEPKKYSIRRLLSIMARFDDFDFMYGQSGFRPLWAEEQFWIWVGEIYGDWEYDG